MSLARTLLNNTNYSSDSIDTSGYVYENVDIDNPTWLDDACESLLVDIYNIDKAYHVADIMGEVKVIKEGLNNDECATILEGVVKTAIAKLKETFMKLWAKLKAWFQSVIRYFKSLLSNNKDFIKEFKQELLKKDPKGFSYKGYIYNLTAGDNAVNKGYTAIMGEVDKCAKNITDHDYRKFSRDNVNTLSANEIADNDKLLEDDKYIISKVGLKSDTLTEMSEELIKIYHNGEDNEDQIEDFKDTSVTAMIKILETSAPKAIKDAEDKQKDTEAMIKKLIAALDKIDVADGKDADSDLVYKSAQLQSRIASKLINVSKTLSSCQVSVWKDASATYRRVLGSFYRWKPAKEGYDFEDDDMDDVDEACGGKKKSSIEGCGSKKGCNTEGCNEATSIFEAAMQLL